MHPLFWMFSAIALAAGLGAIALATSSAKLSGVTVAIIFLISAEPQPRKLEASRSRVSGLGSHWIIA